jgi:hypothetical protein
MDALLDAGFRQDGLSFTSKIVAAPARHFKRTQEAECNTY